MAKKIEKLTGIKGFDANLQCRGFQFQTEKTYTHDGDVVACKSGFHAIPSDQHPLSVLGYYAPAGSRFCRVEYGGRTDREGDKIAAEILSVSQEIGLSALTLDAVKWVTDRAKPEGEAATGDQGAASATGYQGAASATGDRGAASATGSQGAASATGDRGAASAIGDRGAASATGYQGAASATGDRGAASATGDRGAAMTSGCGGRVMGADGNALFAVERETWNGPILSVAAGIVGQDGIVAGTWYRCIGGKLVPTD